MRTIDNPALLPCPFCGSNAKIYQWLDTLKPFATWVECTNGECGIMTDSFHHSDPEQAKNFAITVWNRRVQPSHGMPSKWDIGQASATGKTATTAASMTNGTIVASDTHSGWDTG